MHALFGQPIAVLTGRCAFRRSQRLMMSLKTPIPIGRDHGFSNWDFSNWHFGNWDFSNWRKWIRYLLLAVTALLFCSTPLAGAPPAAEREYRHALERARAGQHEEALTVLADLTARYPAERRFLYDYLAVLGWAERDEDVLAHLPEVSLDSAPPYVLETIGRAARNRHQYPLAVEVYRRAVAQAPQRSVAVMGLAMSLADSGDVEAADAALARLRRGAAPRATILTTRAYIQQSRGDLFGALGSYEAALRQDPGNREALRGRIMLTARIGAPHLAVEMAARHPGILSADELESIERDRRAIAVRWARLPPEDGTSFGTEADAAIIEMEVVLARQSLDSGSADAARRTRYDLIVALTERGYRDAAIAQFEALPDGESIPPYVEVAAAGSYLGRRQPERARDLYLRALAEAPQDFDTRMGLFYAYVDSEDYPAAFELIDELAAEQPESLDPPGPERRTNPDRLTVDSAAALLRAFAERPAEAQRRLEMLASAADHNSDLGADLGFVYLWRGWPRRALEGFDEVLRHEPAHGQVLTGRAQAWMTLAEYRRVDEMLRNTPPGAIPPAQRADLDERWEIENLRELNVEYSRGKSTGVQEGSRDTNLDIHLFSAPFRYRWRGFLHGYDATTEFPEGRAEYRRIGMGFEYRKRDVNARLELSRDRTQTVNAGVSIDADWEPSDHWGAEVGYDSNSDEVPLRGRLNEGIDGWSIRAGLRYRWSEARRLEGQVQRLRFSDSNRRSIGRVFGFQRLYAAPHYLLDGYMELERSSNTRDDAPYFNPVRDRLVAVTLMNDWILYRRYERVFRHRLSGTLGNYAQSGFPDGRTWAVIYEQQWNVDARSQLNYGITRARRLYDGDVEYTTDLFANLGWRF